MVWHIASYPICTHHVFLSHCREDANDLVLPVHDWLLKRGVAPWLDRHDYTYGPTSIEALQSGILNSRHTVFFVTDAMLDVARGWCVVEYTLSRILQANLHRTMAMSNVLLPLFFVDRSDKRLARSVWRDFVERGNFYNYGTVSTNFSEWAAKEILKFLTYEQAYADYVQELVRHAPMYARMMEEPGLIDRVTKIEPDRIPVQDLD